MALEAELLGDVRGLEVLFEKTGGESSVEEMFGLLGNADEG